MPQPFDLVTDLQSEMFQPEPGVPFIIVGGSQDARAGAQAIIRAAAARNLSLREWRCVWRDDWSGPPAIYRSEDVAG